MNRNVIAKPTDHEDEQCWVCLVCKAELCHENPINFKKQLGLLETFIGQHDHKSDSPSKADATV